MKTQQNDLNVNKKFAGGVQNGQSIPSGTTKNAKIPGGLEGNERVQKVGKKNVEAKDEFASQDEDLDLNDELDEDEDTDVEGVREDKTGYHDKI